ncbi:hypothetical protein JCM8097_006531 [Rhodosporidiobolus ruineniae]
MQPSSCLVLPQPYSVRATTTSSHPQLRDLIALTPDGGNCAVLVCYDSLCCVDLYGARPPEYTPLKFSPSTVAYGMGLVAAGGQSSEIALKSASPGSDWCHQHLPASSLPSVTGVRTVHSGSINNSIFIAPSPSSSITPRLLVSNNDEKIVVYDVAGRVPDYQAAKRRRARERREGWSVVEASWAAERGDKEYGLLERDSMEDDSPVEEHPSFDAAGGECTLIPLPHEDIHLRTAVNHCSVSPDGRRMVAVGDTNEVFLYDCRASGYSLAHVFAASNDASFSTDWSSDGTTFAVASQDGFVHVYDIRNLPSASPTAFNPRKLAELKTSQTGPAGAARKVKFSPGGNRLDSGLLAFTEHRNRVHVVDARTFETYQVLDVPIFGDHPASPSGFPATTSLYSTSTLLQPSPPPLRPRPQPPPRANHPRRPPLSRFTSTASAGSGTRTPRDEVERDELEREMRERTEQRFRDEARRVRERAREERRREVEEARRAREARRAAQTTAPEDDEDSEEEDSDEEEDEDEEEWEVQEAEGDDEPVRVVSVEGDFFDEDNAVERTATQAGDDEDEAMAYDPPVAPVPAARRRDSDDESGDDSSVNTTRPRRFTRAEPATLPSDLFVEGPVPRRAPSPRTSTSLSSSSASWLNRLSGPSSSSTPAPASTSSSSARLSLFHPTPPAGAWVDRPGPSSAAPDPSAVLDLQPIRRNFSGYAPLHPVTSASSSSSTASASPWSRLPSNTAARTASSTNFYYTTYAPSTVDGVTAFRRSDGVVRGGGAPSDPMATRTRAFQSLFSAPLGIPASTPSNAAGVGAGGWGTSYHATSAFFPHDSAPGDLLGLDWDEWGERLVVATAERVWEWDVDAKARRGRGEWGVR